jgi:toxin HigB-1
VAWADSRRVQSIVVDGDVLAHGGDELAGDGAEGFVAEAAAKRSMTPSGATARAMIDDTAASKLSSARLVPGSRLRSTPRKVAKKEGRPGVRCEACAPEWLDSCHVTKYAERVIRSFANRETEEVYATGRSKRLPPDILRRAVRKLEYIDLASRLEDLQAPPGNRLHELHRDRAGQHAIAINDQWRICFRFAEGEVYDVEITDYHD